MVEVPMFNHSNVNFQAGLSFRPYASPRFEMKVSVGLWKPRRISSAFAPTDRARRRTQHRTRHRAWHRPDASNHVTQSAKFSSSCSGMYR